jgi:hypothetical protein
MLSAHSCNSYRTDIFQQSTPNAMLTMLIIMHSYFLSSSMCTAKRILCIIFVKFASVTRVPDPIAVVVDDSGVFYK